jgi:hypothetical protein
MILCIRSMIRELVRGTTSYAHRNSQEAIRQLQSSAPRFEKGTKIVAHTEKVGGLISQHDQERSG